MENEKRLDLIDRSSLGIGKAKREVFDNPAYADGWNSAIAIIENAPTVDAVEVVHGRWEYGRWEQGHWVKGNERCRCSVCHRDFAVDNLNIWHGCPHCLAKMDGGNEDDRTGI